MKSINFKKIFSSVLAYGLCLALVFTVQPIGAFAFEHTSDETTSYLQNNETSVSETETAEPYIIKEIESKRDANTKHFLLNDGTYLATTYDIPVHYKDETGAWQQYDNSLDENPSHSEELINKKSDTAVSLSKKAKQNKMIQVKHDGHLIYWGYSGINNSPAELITDNTALTGNDKHTKLKNISVSSVYKNAFPNVDLYILIKSGSVKENLVINEPGSVSSFVVNYDIGDLTAVQQDSKTILLKNDLGETIYTISAPLMYDSNMHYSEAVTLNMTAKGKKVTVELSADKEWLYSPDRAYPVTIDPWVETTQTSGTIDSASLLSYSVPSGSYPHGSLCVGRESSTYGRTASVVKTTLPTLNAGDMVVGAQFALRQRAYSGNADVQVNVSRITSAWTQSQYVTSGTISAGYLNMPSRDPKIEDFNLANANTLTKANEGHLTYWDITSVVKGWYNGEPNNGVMFWSNEPDLYNFVRYVRDADAGNYDNTSFPVVLLTYVNNNGLEPHWSYHDTGVTSRGTAYVNDYTGNLVVSENVFGTTGNRMPMSISLVYNLRNYYKNFKYGASAGLGFMFNFEQRIDVITDTKLIEKGYKYIYTDGDGTEHYFRVKEGSTTEWIDESGLGLTLKETGDTGLGLYLHYKDGSIAHFYTTGSSGVLFYIKDSNGNRIRYYSTTPFGDTYGRLITSIEDGAGRTVTLEYELVNELPRIKKITDNENRVYLFTYDTSDNALLHSITYPDGTVTTYSYNARRLSQIEDSLGYKTVFGFAGVEGIPKTQIHTVSSYSVENNTDTLLGRLSFAYNKDNTTTITDLDGQSQLYQFDNYGRTVSVRYPDGTISNAAYHETAGGRENGSFAPAAAINNNKLISESTSEKYVNNYVVNSSAENDAAFYSSCWDGISNGANSYDNTVAYIGVRSLKIQHNEENEIYNLYGQQIFTTDFADSDYTFSAYVKTENVVPSGNHGAGLIIAFYDSNSSLLSLIYAKNYLTGTNDWTRVSISGHSPVNTAEVRIYCTLRNASGTAWFDCVQLETSPVMNDFNLIENSNFSSASIWSTGNFVSGDSYSGNGSVTIKGGATANKYIYQTIKVNKADVCFNVFGTMNGTLAASRDGRLNGLQVYLKYADGTDEYQTAHFNYDISGRQSISFVVKPKLAGRAVNYIGIYYIVRKTANTSQLENVMVTFDEQGTSYAYDSDGNLISSADNAERNQAYSYNDANELTQFTNSEGETYKYIYNSENEHQLIAARSNQLHNGYRYTYDSYGNIIATAMGEIDESGVLNTALEHFTASQTYNSTGNYVVSETDSRNNTTVYDINEQNGLLNSVTTTLTVNGADQSVTTYYTYYPDTRMLESVITGNSSVTYTYDAKRRLKTITANGNVYTFNYDAYGNRISVMVGNTVLITNTYANPRKGLVTAATYANGDVIGYQYDEYDRLILKDIDEYTKYKVYYNSKGQVAKTEDTYIDETIEYVYDLSGRLTQKIVDSVAFSVYRYKYDNQNRVTDYTETVDGTTVENTYTYGADSLLTEIEQGNFEYSYSYDHLNRLISKTATLSEGKTVRIEYTYIYGTALVGTKKLYLNNVLSETLSYTYDKSGNIATVIKNGTLLESYQYDELGQLVKTTKGSDIYEYTYDTRGNILTAKLNGVVTDTYAYGDIAWKDKLTAFNGQTITYDNIGNPINYRDGMQFNWEKGRSLSQVIVNDGAGCFTYVTNSDGLRVNKDIMWFDGSDHPANYTFEYNGSQLISQTGNSNVIRFLYDESGCPSGFILNGAYYYYLTNLQGDITAITDANGNIVAKYTYDEWGKILSITDGNGNDVSANEYHVANVNPFRYRGYYYDSETGFYYLLTRYYDPVTRRFINADGYVSTGQGFTGFNMFAYCGNNPVSRFDPMGSDWREKLQNLNEKATQKWESIKESTTEFFSNVWDGAVDTYNRITSISQQQQALDVQIRQQQNEMLSNAGKKVLDIHKHSVELQAEQQYRQDMNVKKAWEFFSNDPLVGVDVATGFIGLYTAELGICATVGIVSIPIAGQVALGLIGIGCTVWGLVRVFEKIIQ